MIEPLQCLQCPVECHATATAACMNLASVVACRNNCNMHIDCMPCLPCRDLAARLLKKLNMTGRNSHKWDTLCHTLDHDVVYDDIAMRLWLSSKAPGQGLVFQTKQAQVCTSEPPLAALRHQVALL